MQEKIEELQKQQDMIQDRINKLREVVSKTEHTTFPKKDDEFWAIRRDGTVGGDWWSEHPANLHLLEIGNCFKTREEAELAVQKLKALKRLRDNGLEFKEWHSANLGEDGYVINIQAKINLPLPGDDLNLLFEEEE